MTNTKSYGSVGPHQCNWDYYNTQYFPFFQPFSPKLHSDIAVVEQYNLAQLFTGFSGIFTVDFLSQFQHWPAESILQAHGWSPNHTAKELKTEQYYRPIGLTEDY